MRRAKAAQPGAARARARAATSISPAWREWIVENLCAGADAARVVDGLVAAGVGPRLAAAEVAALAASPATTVARRLTARVQRLELVAALARHVAAQEPTPTEVERRPCPPADEFYRAYVACSRPVVLTDVAARWPARRRWSLAYFRRTLGDQRVDVVIGRAGDPRYDQNTPKHSRRMRLAEFLDRVEAAGVSNDLYLVANNHAMRRPAFARLLADVRPPRGIITSPVSPGTTSLWIGPAGTVTPLHHDTTSVLFNQLVGRKRFELIAPTQTALLLDPVDGFYSPVDLDARHTASHPALRAMQVRTVELGPGDTLYLPAGWWHRVTALDVSISFSLLSFTRPSGVPWYRPGHIAAT